MQPLLDGPRASLTEAAVKGLLQSHAAVRISYGAVAYDADFGEVADISSYIGAGSTVTSDTANSVHRTCSLNIDSDVTDTGWKYLSGFVKPYMVFTDPETGVSARFNLGVYTLPTPSRPLKAGIGTIQFAGYDLLYLLKQPVGDSYEVPANSDPAQAAADVVSLALPEVEVVVTPSGETTSAQLSWPFNADEPITYWDIVHTLLNSIGYREAWADWEGRIRIEPFRDLQQEPFEWTFNMEDDDNIVADEATQDVDVWDVPNWWRFVMADLTDLPVEGVSQFTWTDASPSNPGSTVNRGRLIRYIESVTATSYAALTDYAQKKIVETLNPSETFSVRTQPFPLAWHLDVIQFLAPALTTTLPLARGGERRVVPTGWTIVLDGTQDMEWTWQTITDQSVTLGLSSSEAPVVSQPGTTDSPFFWSGHSWNVREGINEDPGPNNFTSSVDNVKVDGSDLVLGISYSSTMGAWTSAEVQHVGSLGYGRYSWVVDHSEVSTWDIKPVLGLFTYDDDVAAAPHQREIDIELSKWDSATEQSEVWYTVQPPTAYSTWDFPETTVSGPYTYEFYWEPTKVYYRTLDATGNTVGETKVVSGLFVPGTETARMNFWLVNGEPPTNGQPMSVRIKSFTFTPSATFTEPATLTYTFDNDRGFQLKGPGASIDTFSSALSIRPYSTYSTVVSGRLFSLNGSHTIDAEVTQMTDVGTGTIEAILWLAYADPDNYAGFFCANGGLQYRHRVAGVNTDTWIGLYDATAHRWLRVERSGTNILWRTSPDGVTWTTVGTRAQGISDTLLAAVHAHIESGYYGTEVTTTALRVGTLRST